jgi:ketosteroid isomerase-like protein
MKVLSFATVVVSLVAVYAMAGSSSKTATPATAQTLHQLEIDFMNAAATQGADGYMSYYAEDAVELPNGSNALKGKASITKTMAFLNEKDNHLSWTPAFADVSGDIGYTYGTYQFRSRDKDGKSILSYGKYATIWKKQKDGTWKIVLDMGNDSPTPK